MFKREYTLKLPKETDDALTRIAMHSGLSRSEVLTRALSLINIADEERMRDPTRTLAVVSGKGPTLRVHEVIEGIFNG